MMVWRRGNILRKQDAAEMTVCACRWLYNQLNRKKCHHLCGKIIKNKTLGRGRALVAQKWGSIRGLRVNLSWQPRELTLEVLVLPSDSLSLVQHLLIGVLHPEDLSAEGARLLLGSLQLSLALLVLLLPFSQDLEWQEKNDPLWATPSLHLYVTGTQEGWPILTVFCFGLSSICDNQLPVMHALVVLVGST